MRQVVFADDHLVGALQGGIDVAFLAHHKARLARGFLELGAIGDRLVFAVGPVVPDDLQGVAALDRCPRVARDHRDAAERLEFRRPRPSLDFHHLLDAGNLHGLRSVERHDPAAGHRRTGNNGVLHAGQTDVGAVTCRSHRDVAQVHHADLALAQIAEVLRILQSQAFDIRHRLPGGIGCQIAEPDAASARAVDDLVIDRLHFADRHAPAFRRGGLEHRAGRSADLAHRHQIVARAARPVGILVAELGLVAMRLLHLNPRPVGLHLFGNDHRQAGAHARSHFGAVCDDGDGAIRRDRDEHARVHHGAVRHIARAGLVRGEGRARHYGCGEDEAAGEAETLQDAAARNVIDLDVSLEATKSLRVGLNVHGHTPVEAR